jgi:hypothetical protein
MLNKISVVKPEGRRSLERFRIRWECYIEINLKGTGFENVEWLHMVQDKVQWCVFVNAFVNLRVP